MNIQFSVQRLLMEDTVNFTIDDSGVDQLLFDRFGDKLYSIEDHGDTTYSLDRSDFDNFMDHVISGGYPEDCVHELDNIREDGSVSGAGQAYLPGLDVPKKKYAGPYQKKTKKESLSESYSRFKKETRTRSESDQYHQAIKQANKKLDEALKVLEYSAKFKEEFPITELKHHTKKAVDQLQSKIVEAYKKIKSLNQ